MSNLHDSLPECQKPTAGAAETLLARDRARRERMPPPRQHNPEVCGLSYALSCPRCQGGYYRDQAARLDGPEAIELATERWHALRLAHRSVIGDAEDGEHFHPEPLNADQLAPLVWTLLLPRHRALLREVLLDILRPGGDEPPGAAVWPETREALRPLLLDILAEDIGTIAANIVKSCIIKRKKMERRRRREQST
jgi:hypothetical protein